MHGRLDAEARGILLLLLVLSSVALALLIIGSVVVRVGLTHVNHYADLLLPNVGAELFDQVLSLLLERRHVIEYSSNHLSIGAVPAPAYPRRSHRYPAPVLLPLLLPGLCHLLLVVMIRLIYVLQCLQAPLARALSQLVSSSLFVGGHTYPRGHVSHDLGALLQGFKPQDGVRVHRLLHYGRIRLLEVEIMTTFISVLELILVILITKMLSQIFCKQVI